MAIILKNSLCSRPVNQREADIVTILSPAGIITLLCVLMSTTVVSVWTNICSSGGIPEMVQFSVISLLADVIVSSHILISVEAANGAW